MELAERNAREDSFVAACSLLRAAVRLRRPEGRAGSGLPDVDAVSRPRSAGIILFRAVGRQTEILLVHPGGPLWRNKDFGAWQIPKGLVEPEEDYEAAARREVREELGCEITAALLPLGNIRQAGGKTVIAFAAEQDFDPGALVSNMIELEWPPRSSRRTLVPEVDEARWFSIEEARERILPSQLPLVDRLAEALARP